MPIPAGADSMAAGIKASSDSQVTARTSIALVAARRTSTPEVSRRG